MGFLLFKGGKGEFMGFIVDFTKKNCGNFVINVVVQWNNLKIPQDQEL